METVKKQLNENPVVLHLAALPVIIVLSWAIGTFVTWGTVSVLYVLFMIRRVAAMKKALNDHFIIDTVDKERETEHCEWLNMFVRKYWVSCVPRLVAPHISNLQSVLKDNKPPFLHSLKVGDWSMGIRAPRFEVLYPNNDLSDHHNQYDILCNWISDLFVTIVLTLPTRQSLEIRADSVKFRGVMRLNFDFNTKKPESSVISVSFIDEPLIDFAVKPLGGVDLISMPMIHDWLQDIIKGQLKPMLQWPQQLTFTMGGEAEDIHGLTEPIIEVGLVWADELQVPGGWTVINRTSCGLGPANLNRGAGGKDIFLCYRRKPAQKETDNVNEPVTATDVDDEEDVPKVLPEPITGLSIVFPSKGETAPPGFTVIKETVGGKNANLNIGTKGPLAYLAYTRDPMCAPITAFSVHNRALAPKPLPGYTPILITPHGRDADVNSSAADDRVFICYKGGQKSIMGHATGVKHRGLLHIHVDAARGVKAADVGGTSDPYAAISLVGSKSKAVKTKCIETTLEPEWNEHFFMAASPEDTLQVYVYDKDAIGKDDFLGGIRLKLDGLTVGQQVTAWYPLLGEGEGEIRIGVCALDFGLPFEEGKDICHLVETAPMEPKLMKDEPEPIRGVAEPDIEVVQIHSVVDRVEADLDGAADDEGTARVMIGKAGSMKLSNSSMLTSLTSLPFGGEKKSWFVLMDKSLLNFKSEKAADSKEPEATFELDGASVEMLSDGKFEIKDASGKKKWELVASMEEVEEWVSAINNNILCDS